MTSAAFHLPGPPPARSSGAHRSAGCKPLQSPWGPMAVSRSCLCTRAPSQHNWDQADSGRRVLLPASVHLVRTEGASDSRQALCFYRKSQRECALRFWGLVGPENKQHGSQTRESPLRLSVVCKREFRPQARKPMQLCFFHRQKWQPEVMSKKEYRVMFFSLFFFFLTNNRILFLTVLKTRSPRADCHNGWLKAVCFWALCFVSSLGRRG